MSFTFIHAADLHLDTPFVGLAAADEQVAQALRDASLEAWDNLVELALRRGAAFVLLAGDIYDGQDRGVRAQLRLRRGLQRLSDAGIQTFIVHGNHDPLQEGGWSAIRNWPDGVTVFNGDDVTCRPVRRDGRDLACVYGISYARPDVSENLALRFRRGDGEGLHIGLLHCNLGGNDEHGRYSPCTMDDLTRSGLDYWALGHIHRHSLPSPRRPWVVYPGSLQGRSPKPSECGPKGAVVVEADEQSVHRVDFVPLDRARFVWSELDIAGLADLSALRAAMDERADLLRQEHTGRLVLARGALGGTGDLHDQLAAKPIALGELRKELCQAGPNGAAAGVYWESILDQTRGELNLDTIRGRGDFLAEVLQRAESLASQPDQLETFAAEHLAGLEKVLSAAGDLPPAMPTAQALQQASQLALEMLQQESPS